MSDTSSVMKKNVEVAKTTKRSHEEDTLKVQRKKRHIAPESINVEYYIENGLRKVKPYYFTYRAFAKGRWLGETIFNVFVTEFRDQDAAYYKSAIETGLITINGERVQLDTIIKPSDILEHRIHRHEPPCTDKDIKVVFENDDLYVIDKPGGIAVHPAGRFQYNTVFHLLKKKFNIPKLFTANRLDRLTSGIMLIAKHADYARKLERIMSGRQIQKEYICRVDGEFPDGEVKCDVPIKSISFKDTINYAHEDGKPCTTLFERLSYDGQRSLVKCKPLTGRTHQIRIHLRYLGHPIGNDPLYGNNAPYASLLPTGVVFKKEQDDKVKEGIVSIAEKLKKAAQEDSDQTTKCDECAAVITKDPLPQDLYIWLHAWRYAGDEWSYETELPEWANHPDDK